MISLANQDISEGCKLWRYWVYRSWVLYQLNYSQTRLKLAWPMLSLCLIIGVLGIVWGIVFEKESLRAYFLYLVAGYPIWQVLSSSVALGVPSIDGYGRGNGLPMSVFFLERYATVGLKFLNVFPVLIIGVVLLNDSKDIDHLAYIPLAIMNLFLWSSSILIIVTIATSLRPDFRPLVNALMGLAFLATPIIWEVSRLGQYEPLVVYNPFFLPLDLARFSLTGQGMEHPHYVTYAITYTLALTVLSYLCYSGALKTLKHRSS